MRSVKSTARTYLRNLNFKKFINRFIISRSWISVSGLGCYQRAWDCRKFFEFGTPLKWADVVFCLQIDCSENIQGLTCHTDADQGGHLVSKISGVEESHRPRLGAFLIVWVQWCFNNAHAK